MVLIKSMNYSGAYDIIKLKYSEGKNRETLGGCK